MKILLLIASLLLSVAGATLATEEITPYKFSDTERDEGFIDYKIPASSRFITKRFAQNAPDIVYYFSAPKRATFPIVILCGGSSSKEDISSIIHVHRYFLKDFLDRGIAVLTVEQWGVDGPKVDPHAFIAHYTRSERLHDHQAVIAHLKLNPPKGWNGKFIFFGVSEGGPIVTTLSSEYSAITLATINWSGGGDWSWREELWAFIEGMKHDVPWTLKLRMLIPAWLPFSMDLYLPKTRQEYDQIMDQTLNNPTYDKEFMGMTYKYHADALTYPRVDYQKIHTPFLLVTGAKDTIIHSSDAFVEKAKKAGVPITYLRVSDMDHYVRKRPDVVQQSFEWLDQKLR